MSARPIAMVTGASGGIGLELARLLAADGHDLVLVARREDELQRIGAELESAHRIRARSFPDDLSDPAAPDRLSARLQEEGIALDVLINNAGFGVAGALATADERRTREMIDLNVGALTMLTRLVLPGMVARGRGRIMNVASTAAFQPGPYMAVYYATKAYVLSFTEAVAEEVRDSGVTLTALCPGPTRTGFADVAGMESSRLFSSLFVGDAAHVARAGYRAMLRGRRVVVPGALNRLAAFGTRFAPRRVATTLSRLAQERR
jgi:short-subunit dehydrogenase